MSRHDANSLRPPLTVAPREATNHFYLRLSRESAAHCGLIGVGAMKKSESVKFRVDIDTYAALVRHCQQTGGNLSQVLRGFILHELEEQGDSGSTATAAVLEGRPNPALDIQERSACAKVLATVLLGQVVPSSQGRGWKPWARRRREISRLLETLFQELAPAPGSTGPVSGIDEHDKAWIRPAAALVAVDS